MTYAQAQYIMADIMLVLHGISYETLHELSLDELLQWHAHAIERARYHLL